MSRALAGSTALVLVAALLGAAQEPPARKDAPDKDAPLSDAAKETLKAAERIAAGIELETFDKDTWVKAKRIEKPLLLFGDSTRDNDRGSVWAWGDKGRPAAVVELYQNPGNRARWVFAICNTSGGKVRAKRGGGRWWDENDSAAEMKDIPNAFAVAEAAQRPRQIKLLAQKFTGHQFWLPGNTRYELRRLDRPLHAYKDEAAGILEGGLFTLANGTNPEILLFVEARAKDGGKPVWQFTTGRLAHAELCMEYDGKEIFTAPRGTRLSARDQPYWLDFIDTADE
jgi:hypothetical protein